MELMMPFDGIAAKTTGVSFRAEMNTAAVFDFGRMCCCTCMAMYEDGENKIGLNDNRFPDCLGAGCFMRSGISGFLF